MFLSMSRQIVNSLPEDPLEGILAIISDFRHTMAVVQESAATREVRDKHRYEVARQACALLSVYLKREGFAIITPQLPQEGGKLANGEREREREREEAVTQVIRFMNRLETDIEAQRRLEHTENLEELYGAALGPALEVQFSPADLQRLHGLLTSLHALVSLAPDLVPAHRRRLLKRIDRLVGEFRENIHDFSLFWGFVVEMSLAFRHSGADAAVLTDPMKELTTLVWSAQAKAFGLPPDTPLRLLGQDT